MYPVVSRAPPSPARLPPCKGGWSRIWVLRLDWVHRGPVNAKDSGFGGRGKGFDVEGAGWGDQSISLATAPCVLTSALQIRRVESLRIGAWVIKFGVLGVGFGFWVLGLGF